MGNSVKMRQRVERLIARRVVSDLIAAGFLLNVDNGGDGPDGFELPAPSGKLTEVMGMMFATDEERLFTFRGGAPRPFGWVYFVYGNSGYDVVSDYTTNLEPHMKKASELADKYS